MVQNWINCGIPWNSKRRTMQPLSPFSSLEALAKKSNQKKEKAEKFNIGKTVQSPSLIAEHFPGTVMDFTACSLPPPLAFTFDLLPRSDDIVLFYFIYLHVSKSHLHVSKSLFIYLPLLQTTVYLPHPCTELLWRHFIKKDVTGRIYASITPHL